MFTLLQFFIISVIILVLGLWIATKFPFEGVTALIIIIVFLILILFAIPTYSIATGNPIDNPGNYKPGGISSTDSDKIVNRVNPILGTITVIGIVISAITLTVLGIKYMIGSVEEKAEYKKSMIPYIIGVVLLLAASTAVGLIAKLTQDAIK